MVEKNSGEWDLPPAISGIYSGIQQVGHDFTSALCELLDNAITAQANQIDIKINLSPDNKVKAYILDNGKGMDEENLKKALTVGGTSTKGSKDSLGKFGFGLKTASTSQSVKTTIISNKENKNYTQVILDMDIITKENKAKHPWTNDRDKMAPDYLSMLEENYGPGTLIVWEDCKTFSEGPDGRKLENKDIKRSITKQIKDKIKPAVSLNYGKLIKENGITFKINNEEIESWDPFYKKLINHENEELKTIQRVLEEKQLRIMDVNKGTSLDLEDPLIITGYIIAPKDILEKNNIKNHRIGLAHQGLYYYRNKRLIMKGSWPNSTVHNWMNLVRIEVEIPPGLDNYLSLNTQKDKIILPPELSEHISKITHSIRQEGSERFKARASMKKRERADAKGLTEDVNKSIKKNLKKDKKFQILGPHKDGIYHEIKNEQSDDILVLKVSSSEDPKEFLENFSLTEKKLRNSNLFEVNVIGMNEPDVEQELSVKISTDHPFYSKIMANKSVEENPLAFNSIMYIFWSHALSYINSATPNIQNDFLDGLIDDLSERLRNYSDQFNDLDE
tara:strand:+ start:1939 stop:3621 length:1683 start_codon:yes stop_codon:yes gene_type:complete